MKAWKHVWHVMLATLLAVLLYCCRAAAALLLLLLHRGKVASYIVGWLFMNVVMEPVRP